MSMEVEAFIFGKKIGTILLKDGIVYFEYDREFKGSKLEISPIKLPLSLNNVYTNTDDKYFSHFNININQMSENIHDSVLNLINLLKLK